MVLFLVACGTYAILGEHWAGKARYPYREVTFDGPAAVSVGWVFIAHATLAAMMLMPSRKWAARRGLVAFFAVMGAVILMVKRQPLTTRSPCADSARPYRERP